LPVRSLDVECVREDMTDKSVEDAWDCFTAISLVPRAAEKRLKDELKPSDAAKSWVAVERESFQHAHGTGGTPSTCRDGCCSDVGVERSLGNTGTSARQESAPWGNLGRFFASGVEPVAQS
jgi:hypothetical protein